MQFITELVCIARRFSRREKLRSERLSDGPVGQSNLGPLRRFTVSSTTTYLYRVVFSKRLVALAVECAPQNEPELAISEPYNR